MLGVEPVGNYAIRINWNDGHNTGILFLRALPPHLPLRRVPSGFRALIPRPGARPLPEQLLQFSQRLLQPLRPVQHTRKQISLLPEPLPRIPDMELAGIEPVLHFAPFERRRHRRARISPQHIGRGDGLRPAVLQVIEIDPVLLPLGDRARSGEQVGLLRWPPAARSARRTCASPRRCRRARPEYRRACRRRPWSWDSPPARSRPASASPAAPHPRSGRTGTPAGPGRSARSPDYRAWASGSSRGCDRCSPGSPGRAGWRGLPRRLRSRMPNRSVSVRSHGAKLLRHVLLKEERLLDSVGIALEGKRPVLQVRQDQIGHGIVVIQHIALGVALRRDRKPSSGW